MERCKGCGPDGAADPGMHRMDCPEVAYLNEPPDSKVPFPEDPAGMELPDPTDAAGVIATAFEIYGERRRQIIRHLVSAAIAHERERCARVAETAFDHMSPLAIYESYRGGDRPVTRLNVQASARAHSGRPQNVVLSDATSWIMHAYDAGRSAGLLEERFRWHEKIKSIFDARGLW